MINENRWFALTIFYFQPGNNDGPKRLLAFLQQEGHLQKSRHGPDAPAKNKEAREKLRLLDESYMDVVLTKIKEIADFHVGHCITVRVY